MPAKKTGLFVRSSALDGEAGKIKENERTVPAVIATEAPTLVIDTDTYEVVREILLMSGAIYPADGQVVLLDNHSRYEGTVSVKGSVRNIKIDGETLRGDVVFATTADVNDIWTKVTERHLRDVSSGYRIYNDETIILAPGESTVISGRSIKNDYPDGRNLFIRKKWQLKEVSVTPIGADENSKLFRQEPLENNPKPRSLEMDPKELERIRKEAEDAVRAAHKNETEEAVRAAVERGRKDEMVRQDEIRSLVTILPEALRAETETRLIKGLVKIEEARRDVIECLRKSNETQTIPPHNTTVNFDEADKFRSAAVDGLVYSVRNELTDDDGKRDAKREREISKSEVPRTLHDLARECAYRETRKNNAYKMNGEQVFEYAKRAWSVATGDLPNILLDALNKSILDSFAMEPTTFQLISDAGNAKDFKDVHVIGKSGLSDWDKLLDGEDFQFGKFSDKREHGALSTYGKALSIPRSVWINDDMGAINDLVSLLGEGAKQKLNKDFYTLLCGTAFAGPTMHEDTTAMFTTGTTRLNFKASSGVVSVANLDVVEKLLKAIKRLAPDKTSGSRAMGLPGKYLLTGTDNMRSIQQVLETSFDISKSIIDVKNPYYNVIEPIFDRDLQNLFTDGSAANSWYLFSQKPIRVLYLNGNQTPTIRRAESAVSRSLGTIFDAYFDYGFVVKDWRYGVYADGK